MRHLGDITKISGHTAPIVDCIIGGSPCQDLSMAGKRAGLDGERSGLFMEQIRIIKEMREEDERRGNTGVDVRPRYMVWENVPGAFSSNKGEDFRIVLEETAKVADKDAVIPRPENGKWTTSGCIMGDGWSIAWRVLDSQFFGTSDKPLPQRRRRIALVADFGGHSASEILFVRKSVSGDIEPSKPKGKGTSSDAEGGFGESDTEGVDVASSAYTLKIRSVCEGGGKGALIQTDKSATLSTLQDQTLFQPVGVDIYNTALTGDKPCPLTAGGHTSTGTCPKVITVDQGGGKSACNVQEGQAPTLTCTHGGGPVVCYSIENHPADSRVNIDESGKVQTLTSRMGTGGGNVPMVMEQSKCDDIALDRAAYNQGKNAQFDFEVSDKGINSPLVAKGPSAVCYGIDQQGGKGNASFSEDVMPTICSDSHGTPHALAYAVDCRNCTENSEVNGTLQTHPGGGTSLNLNNVVRTNYIVRRLTPLECERLQGFPDGWTDIGEWIDSKGKVHKTSDSSRYKALGNSIALPPWKWILKRLCACYERDATMASLFDGIGGFPLIWEQLNGKGTCLWASEIEEFPMAVTRVRFGE